MTRTTIICCCAYDKDGERFLTYSLFAIIIAIFLSVLSISFFFEPLIYYGGYNQYSCRVNTSTFNVYCTDKWESVCYFTAVARLEKYSTYGNDVLVRYPVYDGVPLPWVESKIQNVNYTYLTSKCYATGLDSTSLAFWTDPTASTQVLTYGVFMIIVAVAGFIAFLYFMIKSVRPAYVNYQNVHLGGYTLFKTLNDDNDGEDGSILRAVKEEKLKFIRLTYIILSIQLLITFSTIGVFVLHKPATLLIQENWWIMLVGFGGAIVFLIPLFFLKDKKPWNYILLFLFTIGMSLMIAFVCSFFGITIVFHAALTTLLVFISLTIFTLQNKYDFSFLAAALYSILSCVLIFIILLLFFPYSSFYQITYAVLGAIVFCLLIIFDTSLLMEKLGPGDEILAAINLYLDFVNLFIRILYLFAKMKR